MTELRDGVHHVCVPGRRLAVRRSDPPFGTAPGATATILLHGVPQTSRCWDPLVAELGQDRTVLTPDLPGLGDSEVRGPYDVRAVASSIVSLLVAELDVPDDDAGPDDADPDDADPDDAGPDDAGPGEGPPHRPAAPPLVDLVGHDWGGSVALAVAAARPDLVRRVVVISAPYRHVDLVRAWHIPVLGFVPPAVFAGFGAAMVRGMFRYAWGEGSAPAALVANYAAAYADRDRTKAMAGYYRAAVRRTSRGSGELPSVRAERSLVVWGTEDAPMPLRVGESVVSDLGRVNDPASVRMITLPGVGHWPLDEAPATTVRAVAEFLRAD